MNEVVTQQLLTLALFGLLIRMLYSWAMVESDLRLSKELCAWYEDVLDEIMGE